MGDTTPHSSATRVMALEMLDEQGLSALFQEESDGRHCIETEFCEGCEAVRPLWVALNQAQTQLHDYDRECCHDAATVIQTVWRESIARRRECCEIASAAVDSFGARDGRPRYQDLPLPAPAHTAASTPDGTPRIQHPASLTALSLDGGTFAVPSATLSSRSPGAAPLSSQSPASSHIHGAGALNMGPRLDINAVGSSEATSRTASGPPENLASGPSAALVPAPTSPVALDAPVAGRPLEGLSPRAARALAEEEAQERAVLLATAWGAYARVHAHASSVVVARDRHNRLETDEGTARMDLAMQQCVGHAQLAERCRAGVAEVLAEAACRALRERLAADLADREELARAGVEGAERAARREMAQARAEWECAHEAARVTAGRLAALERGWAARRLQRFARRQVVGRAAAARQLRRLAVACESRREEEARRMALEDHRAQRRERTARAFQMQCAWRRAQRAGRMRARAALRMQAVARGFLERRRWPVLLEYREEQRTEWRTQALERKWLAREETEARPALARALQEVQQFQGYREAMAATKELQKRKSAAKCVQDAWRRLQRRRSDGARREAQRQRAAVKLQAVARGWGVRRMLPGLRQEAEEETRRQMEGRWRMQSEAERVCSARVIQRAWRAAHRQSPGGARRVGFRDAPVARRGKVRPTAMPQVRDMCLMRVRGDGGTTHADAWNNWASRTRKRETCGGQLERGGGLGRLAGQCGLLGGLPSVRTNLGLEPGYSIQR